MSKMNALWVELERKDAIEYAIASALNHGLDEAAKVFQDAHWTTTVGLKGGTSYSTAHRMRTREVRIWVRECAYQIKQLEPLLDVTYLRPYFSIIKREIKVIEQQ